MGCRLPKLRKAEERRSPGNIYSTLRRPQVETKVGVAYTYHFLDFLLGKEEVSVSSVLCLSSVRELPVQVRELYAQGFVLVAVHPFVHPCGPRQAHIQRQLHRAVLVRETPSSEKSQLRWGSRRLETDVCVAGHQCADPEAIQSYVKRIQDVAEQGVVFVGFLQQPGGAPCFSGHRDPDELSSLHSSPSPIHRNPFSADTSPTDPTEPPSNDLGRDRRRFSPRESDSEGVERDASSEKPIQTLAPDQEGSNERIQNSQVNFKDSAHSEIGHAGHRTCPTPSEPAALSGQLRGRLPDLRGSPENRCPDQRRRRSSSSDSWPSSPELDAGRHVSGWTDGRVTTHDNNNHIWLKGSEEDGRSSPPNSSAQARMQLFALYNHTGELNTALRFYSLRVPLQVQTEAGRITDVDAHWLDHMTHHFTSGALLVDGFFHLEGDNENGLSSVDSVFIFQSSADETTSPAYDAIVVEQWTVVDGVAVKADYIPLLQSLAPFGWRLTCVLPTPIVKTNSDGSLSTKQVLFLQRPVLQRRRRDFKFQMLNLRGRSKTKKKSAGGIQARRDGPVMETEMDRLRGEAGQIWDSERRRGGGGGGGEGVEPAEQPGAFSLVPGTRAFEDEEQEEETDIDEQKPARCVYVFRRDGGGGGGGEGGVKAEVKMEEQLKRQLFSGVC
ncbi:raftlin [Brachionichthys hirsutus]|uniref:raftlin n=1 Tax=Brachionichthys hirsutus TaxID=412623 RepID=UPI0036047574